MWKIPASQWLSQKMEKFQLRLRILPKMPRVRMQHSWQKQPMMKPFPLRQQLGQRMEPVQLLKQLQPYRQRLSQARPLLGRPWILLGLQSQFF
jgi:hypothetical protein